MLLDSFVKVSYYLHMTNTSHIKKRRTPSSIPDLPAHVSIPDVAVTLSVHENTVRKLCREGKLAAVKIGRVWRVEKESLRAFLRAHGERSKYVVCHGSESKTD